MNRIVSVLVVALMVLVALGLGIPALMRWRTLAERTRCENHVRQVAFGVSELMEIEKAFPPGTMVVKDRPPERRLSWVVYLLPRLGQSGEAKQIDTAATWNAEVNRDPGAALIKSLLCPSLVDTAVVDGYGALHYPGIAGVGADAPNLDRSDSRAGIYCYNEATPLAAVKDGTSNVVLLLETSRNVGPWIAGGPPSVRGLDPSEQPYLGEGRQFGGAHRGGANAVYADGHSRFLSEKISPAVLEMLAAMADGQADPGA
jgi:prepilin-type processing-associated H-X9-DG protein